MELAVEKSMRHPSGPKLKAAYRLASGRKLTADDLFIVNNPEYNGDRGLVSVPGTRPPTQFERHAHPTVALTCICLTSGGVLEA